jgi:hypothetical protein
MSRVKGGGHLGPELTVACIPDATFETELDALIAAGTDVIGKLVTLTFSGNYEVTSAAQNAIPDGVVLNFHKAGTSYILDVDLVHYTDQNSANHTPRRILNVPYNGTFNLQDSVIVYSTTYMTVADGGTGGFGAAIAVDVPGSGYADILF